MGVGSSRRAGTRAREGGAGARAPALSGRAARARAVTVVREEAGKEARRRPRPAAARARRPHGFGGRVLLRLCGPSSLRPALPPRRCLPPLRSPPRQAGGFPAWSRRLRHGPLEAWGRLGGAGAPRVSGPRLVLGLQVAGAETAGVDTSLLLVCLFFFLS